MSSTNVFEPVVHRPFTKTEDDGKDAGSQFVHSSFNIFGVVGAVGIAVDDLDGEGTGASVTDDVDDGLNFDGEATGALVANALDGDLTTGSVVDGDDVAGSATSSSSNFDIDS